MTIAFMLLPRPDGAGRGVATRFAVSVATAAGLFQRNSRLGPGGNGGLPGASGISPRKSPSRVNANPEEA